VQKAARALARQQYLACLTPEQVGDVLASCATKMGSTGCTVSVLADRKFYCDHAPSSLEGEVHCSHSVGSLEWQGRRWIKIATDVSENATAFTMINITELRGGAAVPYYSGDLGGSALCGGRGEASDHTSEQMRADWPRFPPHVRKPFFCP
jgi:hypothetical protein